MSYTYYTDTEMNIVERGIEAIQEVLMGTDMDAKRRLIFCLDRYLDPWYGYKLPYVNEINTLLEKVIISENELSVKEDAIQLLTDYAWGPFPVLEKYYACVEEVLKPDVRYTINMRNVQSIVAALLSECEKIYYDLKKEYEAGGSKYGTFPSSAVVLYRQEGTSEFESYLNHTDFTWKIEKGKTYAADKSIKSVNEPLSGRFYKEACFAFCSGLSGQPAYLLYQLGPGWGRCFAYDLLLKDDKTELVNQKVIWFS